MKLAFIVQRYGKEILGGSETLARQLAERLSRRHEITVLTTTAKDYITWKNEYEPGEEKHKGVRILRFRVEEERSLEDFNKFSEMIYKGGASREQELDWLRRQGPVVPELIDYLKKEHERFDLLVFFTYLYYPTYYGLQVAPEKSVLVPTAHDEPPLRLGIFREMFQLPSSFLFNTEAEELLVLERFPVHKKMRETIGMGMELLDQPDLNSFRRAHGIPGKYLLYAGRIDAGKGLEELFRFFNFYKEEHPGSGNLQLILIGKLGMKLPADASIRYIGFVDEGEKLSAMAGAVAVVQPSRMESLSIVTLEAFSVGTPIIASSASKVLLDHCRRANAGLYYGDFEEFEEVLTLLLSDRNLARSLGRNGQSYVKENYGWNRLLPKYELVFRSSARPSKEPRGGRRAGSERPPAEAQTTSPRRSREEAAPAAEVEAEVRTEELPLLEAEEVVSETGETKPDGGEPAVPAESTKEEAPAAEASSGVAIGEEEGAEPAPPATGKEPEPVASEEVRREATPGVPDVPGVKDASVPPEEPSEERLHEEPVASAEPPDPEVAHLPSFYRSSIPHRPPPASPPSPPEPPENVPPENVPEVPAPVEEVEEPAKREEAEEAERTTSASQKKPPVEPMEPMDEDGLPEFYRPRPRPADRDEPGQE